jgi:hypothetical protein
MTKTTATLRIFQRGISDDQGLVFLGRHKVELTLDNPNQSAATEFYFDFLPMTQEHFRWYFEDHLVMPAPAGAQLARHTEQRIAELGIRLFWLVFKEDAQASAVWEGVKDKLSTTRIEVLTDSAAFAALPWELLRETPFSRPLALSAREFVRIPLEHELVPSESTCWTEPGRRLFRVLLVIARPRGVNDVAFRVVAEPLIKLLQNHNRIELLVLRPPTFEALQHFLAAGWDSGRPIDLVHFDGHGVYEQNRGFLKFENPDAPSNVSNVTGRALGERLAAYGVRVLVMNACRSAYAKREPRIDSDAGGLRMRAYSSIAHQVLDAGVQTVVALQYAVTPKPAVAFIEGFYRAFLGGETAAAAVTEGRRSLNFMPARWLLESPPGTIDDWYLPLAYESFPVLLGAPAEQLNTASGAPQSADAFGDCGYGRDELLLMLDRAFDRKRIVLLHGPLGSGKSSGAAEFVSWYSRSGGVAGPVHWLNERDLHARLEPTDWGLVVVDNLPNDRTAIDRAVNAFGSPPHTKLLLILVGEYKSSITEREAIIRINRLDNEAALQCAKAIADNAGGPEPDVEALAELIEFAQGNPLALQVVCHGLFRCGSRSKFEAMAFVRRLQAGDCTLPEGFPTAEALRAAAIDFMRAATDIHDRAVAALVYLFRNFISSEVVAITGEPQADWCLEPLRGISLNDVHLSLARLSSTGLIWSLEAEGCYALHPLAPWALRPVFDEIFSTSPPAGAPSALDALRAFAESNSGVNQRFRNDKRAVGQLYAEAANLLHVRRMAMTHGWWRPLAWSMLALEGLHRGFAETLPWEELVEETAPLFVDGSGSPMPGRERYYKLFATYSIELLSKNSNLVNSLERQRLLIEFCRNQAVQFEDATSDVWRSKPYELYALASSYHDLAKILLSMRSAECSSSFVGALRLFRRMDDWPEMASIYHNLGHARRLVPTLHNLGKAE